MVGTTAHGQLAASPAPTRPGVHFAVASSADDGAIRRLLRENPMRGAVSLTFEREPDYFLGANIGGASDTVIVAQESSRLVCMGRCTTRDAWVNGRVRRVGYLAELRLDASAQGRLDVLRGGYRFFERHRETRPADFYFTSIAADNDRARRLLERGVPGLPRYVHLADLTTLLVSTRTPVVPGFTLEAATPEELAAFFTAAGSRLHLAAAWAAPQLRAVAAHDLRIDAFRVLRRNGRIIAAAALWDQRRFRQVVVRGYAPALGCARPLINACGRIVGLPTLPAVGSVLAHAHLSPLAIARGHDPLLPDLIAAFCRRAAAQGIDYLTLALPSAHAGLSALKRRFCCRTYASRLYRVAWPGDVAIALDGRFILPDIALL